jgi:hypothetical protein
MYYFAKVAFPGNEEIWTKLFAKTEMMITFAIPSFGTLNLEF